MFISQIGQHEVLLPINHNRYNFRKNMCFIFWFAIAEVANTTLNKLVSLKKMTRELNWKATFFFLSQERIALHQRYSERVVEHCKKSVKLPSNNTYKIYSETSIKRTPSGDLLKCPLNGGCPLNWGFAL